MRYVVLFVGGFFILFYDGYYNAWRYTNTVMRQVDSWWGYIMSLFG